VRCAILFAAGVFVFCGELWGDPNLADTLPAGLTLLALAVLLGILVLGFAEQMEAVRYKAAFTARMAVVLLVMMAAHTWLAAWKIQNTPKRIDCFTFQQDAVESLLKGKNPYGGSHANIYNPDETNRYYAHGMVVDGRVQVGLQYPPETLLPALAGYGLGDIRYGYLLTILIAALLAAAAMPGWRGIVAAGFILWNPLTFFTESDCWTEPLVLMMVCAVVYAARRKQLLLPLFFGLLLASKQYNVIALPLFALLVPPSAGKVFHSKLLIWLLIALAVAAATMLPFALWDSRALWHDLVQFHFAQPYRTDAVSFAVPFPWIMKLGPVALLAFLLWCLMRVQTGSKSNEPRVASFLVAYGVALLIFFVTAKQAFCNYYFVISQLFLLVAADQLPLGDGAVDLSEAACREEGMPSLAIVEKN
jgi:hypothetical protein